MTNPTSNFGWQMPTNTDLVTDLPADFAVFGQAVDTSMADLLGGTTGQILTKNSNTNMDFVWVTNDVGDITAVNVTSPITGGGSSGAVTVGIQSASTSQSGAVQLSDSTSTTSSVLASTPTATKAAYDLAAAAVPKSTVTAKGSIVAATAASTPANLAVGNNGETLVADSAATTGLRYTAGTVQSNPVLNSAFQVWQRGTSVAITASSTSAYQADRWQGYRGATGGTVSRQVTGDTTNLPNIQYCGRIQRDSGNTSTVAFYYTQSFETINSIPFAGKTVTFSFYARAGANYSAASSALGVYVASGTGTDQNQGAGYTGQVGVINTSATLTTSWQRFTYSGTIGATATELAVQYSFTPVGTAGVNDYFEVTGVQLDIGSVALPFRTYAGTIQGELAACQRYYWRGTSTNAYGTVATPVIGASTTTAYAMYRAPVTMRTTPSAIEYANLALNDTGGATALTVVAINRGNPDFLELTLTAASGLTQYRTYFMCGNNNTAAYLGITAEL
jgi:hypothetical protein